MHKVLFVDDEILIREAISENVKWEALGYEFMGACEDGRDAIAAIEKEIPDLILTDIYMPYVDGIELSKYIYEHYPEIKVVILTGYDKFEYARQAVRYQVFEYILKPVTSVELGETLTKVKKKLDYEKEQEHHINQIRSEYIRNLPQLKARFLNNLVLGSQNREIMELKFREFGINLPGKCFLTVIIEGDDYSGFLKHQEDTLEVALFAIYNIADELVANYGSGAVFQNIDNKTTIIFSGTTRSDFEHDVLMVCEEIRWAVRRFLNIETTIGIGETVSSLSKLYQSYESTRSILDYRFLFGGKQILRVKDFRDPKAKEPLLDIQPYITQVISGIKMSDSEAIQTALSGFALEIKRNFISRQRSFIYIQNIVLSIMNFIVASGAEEQIFLQEERELYNKLYQCEVLTDIIFELEEFCRFASRKLEQQREGHTKKQAVMAIAYIDKNYQDPSVSLHSVCTSLAISPSYFSSVFKQHTGETFIEALTRKRIDTARELLETTTLKAYEIAAEVGFSDSHYFSSTFKKLTGKTPTEYQKWRRNG